MEGPDGGAARAEITIKIRQQEPAGEYSLTVAGDVRAPRTLAARAPPPHFLLRPQPSFSPPPTLLFLAPRMRASVELEPDASSNSPPRLIQVDILTLKGMIEPVCGVPAATQRLLHRGRVLKDDQRVSNARLADGDTILLVQRPPDAPAATEGAAQGVGVGTGNANANANANGMPPNLVHMGQVRIPHGSSGAAQISQVVNAVLSRNGHGATTTANDFSSLGEGGNVTFELTMGPNGGAPTIRRVEGAPGAGSPAGPAGADGADLGESV